jgi:hypothetical protein
MEGVEPRRQERRRLPPEPCEGQAVDEPDVERREGDERQGRAPDQDPRRAHTQGRGQRDGRSGQQVGDEKVADLPGLVGPAERAQEAGLKDLDVITGEKAEEHEPEDHADDSREEEDRSQAERGAALSSSQHGREV